jgi:hypothetical protein
MMNPVMMKIGFIPMRMWNMRYKLSVCISVMLIAISGCANAKLNQGIDPVGNPVCLTDCKEIPIAIEKFKKIHSLKSERDELEYLFYRIRSSNEKFDRNGTIYDALAAFRFLRWKIAWYQNRYHERISTDEDFVSKVLRGSEKTGKPYSIIMENGKKYNAQFVMQNELRYLNTFNVNSQNGKI